MMYIWNTVLTTLSCIILIADQKKVGLNTTNSIIELPELGGKCHLAIFLFRSHVCIVSQNPGAYCQEMASL